MYEKFNDLDKALSYLISGLRDHFPRAHAEVMYFARDRVRRDSCDVEHISPVLERMCRRFPKASVEYDPQNAYGYVAEIQCHGEMNPLQQTHFGRRRDSDRPRVVIMLTRVADKDVLIGGPVLPKMGRQAILDK